MITEICADLRNWFDKGRRVFGTFEISGGNFSEPLDFLKNGQYFRIVGSDFNDGVYQYGLQGVAFIDETFDGCIWPMSVPPDFIQLVNEITAFQTNENNAPSPYTSESFGPYSYSRATTANGTAVGWREVFSSRLNRWRKI